MSGKQEQKIIRVIEKISIWFVGIGALVAGLIALAIALTAVEGRNILLKLSLAVVMAAISFLFAKECRRMSA